MTAAAGSSRVFWACLLLQSTLIQVISYGLRPAISYAVLEHGHSTVWLGIFAAVFSVPPLLVAIPIGRVIDRRGERGFLIAGSIAMVAAALCVMVARGSLALLGLAVMLTGLGVLFSVVAQQSVVSNRARDDRMDSLFGIYTFATSFGQALGPLLLILPPSAGSATPPAELISIVCLGAALVAGMLTIGVPSSPIHPANRPNGAVRETIELLRIRGMPRAFITSSVVLSSLDIALAYLPALTSERGISPAWISAMLIARSSMSMVSRLLLGRLVRAIGRRRTIVLGSLISVVALVSFAMPIPEVALLAAAAVYGFAAGVCQPLTMTWVTLLTPRGQRGAVVSLRLAGNRVGQSGIPLVAGVAASFAGVSGVFAVTALFLVMATVASTGMPDTIVGKDDQDHTPE